MIRNLLLLMAKEEFFCLAPFIIQEAHLMYKNFNFFQHFFFFGFSLTFVFVDERKIRIMQMWEGLIQKAKEGGLDVIDTYVFWNLHEPSPGNVSCSFLVFFFPLFSCIISLVFVFSFIKLCSNIFHFWVFSTISREEMIWFGL